MKMLRNLNSFCVYVHVSIFNHGFNWNSYNLVCQIVDRIISFIELLLNI